MSKPLVRFQRYSDFGRLGNQMHFYYQARSYAESVGADFEMQPWIGESVFKSVSSPITDRIPDEVLDHVDRSPTLYDRALARSYFELLPEFDIQITRPLVLHLRRGDLMENGCPFPMIALGDYRAACEKMGFPWTPTVVSDDVPFQFWRPGICDPALAYMLDFSVMLRAKRLFVANSTFSWWAAFLGYSEAYEPVNEIRQGQFINCDFRKVTF